MLFHLFYDVLSEVDGLGCGGGVGFLVAEPKPGGSVGFRAPGPLSGAVPDALSGSPPKPGGMVGFFAAPEVGGRVGFLCRSSFWFAIATA